MPRAGSASKTGWSGDEAVRLYGAHRLSLVRLAVLLVDDLSTAEDVVQRAFAAFLGRSTGLRDPDQALAYLRSSVVSLCRSAVRGRREAAPAPEVLRGLPPRQREVLALRYWLGLTEPQAADTMGISVGAVRAAAHRALPASGTTRSEDRLGAALRARAETVEVEDLRPPELPAPVPAPRRRLLVPLASVAVAVLVAAPFVAGGGADPLPPVPVPEPDGALRMDVDGDGDLDAVSVEYEPSIRVYDVQVQLLDGPAIRYSGLAGSRPNLIGAADLDDDGAAEIAVHVGDDPDALPEFFRYADGNIRRLRPPATLAVVNGWPMASELNRYALVGGRLYTWQFDPDDPRSPQQTGFWRWEVEGKDGLAPGAREQRCVDATDVVPSECSIVPRVQRQTGEADVDGDGAVDRVTLSFVAADRDATVRRFEVEVALAAGSTATVEGPAGWWPRLRAPVAIGDGDRQQVVVEQADEGSGDLALFGLAGSELVRLTPTGPGPGFQRDPAGGGRDWRAGPRRLVSVEVPPDGSAGPGEQTRVRVADWTVQGKRLVRVEDGEQCLDPSTGDLPAPC